MNWKRWLLPIKKGKKLSINNADEKPQTDALTLEMDKGHEYIVLRRIMLSAQQADSYHLNLWLRKSQSKGKKFWIFIKNLGG